MARELGVDLGGALAVAAVAQIVHDDDGAGRIADEGHFGRGARGVVVPGVGLEGFHLRRKVSMRDAF